MLSDEKELQRIKEERGRGQITILKCPKFWRTSGERLNLRSNSQKGVEKFDIEWGYLYSTDCDILKLKMNVLENVNIEILVNYMQ